MGIPSALPLSLGAVAVVAGTGMVTFDIIFAITLSPASSSTNTQATAIVASVLGLAAVALILLLLGRQIRHRNGAHIQDLGHGRQYIYLLAGFGALFGILAAAASAVLLGMIHSRIADLPKRTIHSSTEGLVVVAFVVWAAFLLSQALFMICQVVILRKGFAQQTQPYLSESRLEPLSEMQHSRPQPISVRGSVEYRENTSMESRTSPSSSGRSRSGSDTMISLRSSVTKAIRPANSKTKLINPISPHRPNSIESSYPDASISAEDGFDSWDTSTVDAESREAVESASPPPRFLETIPASPNGSRSPSPGCPLDLEPPKSRKRSKSYSPANSYRDLSRTQRTNSIENLKEAHIHPLFRTDSPTPPPATTAGTIVTAAPGAGQLISDVASIRSIHRMRSGSLPSSPLMHSESLESIKQAIGRADREIPEETGGERTLTPPIPDWILGAGTRSSMVGYNSRRKPAGLGKVGEVREP